MCLLDTLSLRCYIFCVHGLRYFSNIYLRIASKQQYFCSKQRTDVLCETLKLLYSIGSQTYLHNPCILRSTRTTGSERQFSGANDSDLIDEFWDKRKCLVVVKFWETTTLDYAPEKLAFFSHAQKPISCRWLGRRAVEVPANKF